MTDKTADWDIDSRDWIERLNQSHALTTDQYILKNPGDTLVAEQIHCYPKAAHKFPDWHKIGMIYTKLSLEQSSGQLAAEYKAKLTLGSEVWDLTGGLGMDSAAFSRIATSVHHNEPNQSLSRISRHNHKLIGLPNIKYHNELAENLIQTITYTDTIYLDPSRRSDSGRIFLLKDCVPNAIHLLPALKRSAKRIIIKLSPLYDLKRIVNELPGTRQIHVVSVLGEVREILVLIDEKLPEGIYSVTLPENLILERTPGQTEVSAKFVDFPDIGEFIHVADPAIYKADTLAVYATNNKLSKWGSGGYLTSDSPVTNGAKSYRIIKSLKYSNKELRKILKGAKVNIHKRNFPIEVSSLYKSLETTMGDDYHIFFTTLKNGTKAVCITEPPINSSL